MMFEDSQGSTRGTAILGTAGLWAILLGWAGFLEAQEPVSQQEVSRVRQSDDAGTEANSSVPASVDEVLLGEMRLRGMWGAAQERVARRMAMSPLDDADFILADVSLKQKRKFTEYSGDISGRWIAVAAFLAPLYPEPFAAFPKIMAELPTYQKNDGHFGAEQNLPRIEHDRDKAILWGNGRLLIGLVEVYEQTGNKKALETARKLGEYFIATDSVYNKPENIARKPGGYHSNLEAYYLSCIEGLAALGSVTGEERHLDQGKRIAELALTVTNFDTVHSHGRLCAVRGFIKLFAVTQNPHWLKGAERDWKIFMNNHRLPIGGVKEVLQPSNVQDEGCSESDWLRLNLALWRWTGKGRYLDEAERCLKNHFIYNQYSNGGAGHRVFHQIDGRPVAFAKSGWEAWWCCAEHWARATVDVARLAVTGGKQGPSINLMVDCAGSVSGPGGKWEITQRETEDGLHVALQPPRETKATLRIHRPTWAREGATIEKPESLSLHQTDSAWLIEGIWSGPQEIAVHLPTSLRSEEACCGSGVLLRGHDILAAHRQPTNAWLVDSLPGVRPAVLWSAAKVAENGRVVVPASLEADPDAERSSQWRPLELAPLRAVAGEPHEAAWFSFRLRTEPDPKPKTRSVFPVR